MPDSNSEACNYSYTPPGLYQFGLEGLDSFDCSRSPVADSEYCIWHQKRKKKDPEAIIDARQNKAESLNGCYLQNCFINGQSRATSGGEYWTVDEIDFKECVLAEANLAQSSLRAIDFSNAVLRDANLRDCRLSGSVLRGVNATNADFTNAVVGSADLSNANLNEATLTDAHLFSTNFSESRISNPEFEEADLEEADFTGAIISQADFTDADLTGATFSKANVSKSVNFSGCDLEGCDFSGAELGFVDFSDANLRRADFSDAHLGYANLRGANLRNSKLNNAHLTNASIDKANLRGAEAQDATLNDACLRDADAKYATFTGCSIQDTDLANVDARGAVFRKSSLEGANLKNTDLRGADLRLAATYNSVFDDVIINEETDFGNVCIYEQASEEYLKEQTKYWGFHHGTGSRADTHRLEKAEWVYRQYELLSRRHFLPRQAQQFYVRQKDSNRKKVFEETFLYRRLSPSSSANDEQREANSESNEEAAELPQSQRRKRSFARIRTVVALPRRFFDWIFKLPLLRTIWNELHRWTTRYGESPYRVIAASLSVIIVWTLLFPLTKGIEGDQVYSYTSIAGQEDGLSLSTVLIKSLYFSIVSFTTVGYGDLEPLGTKSQLLAGTESFLGGVLIALLVFTLSRRVTR